MQALRPEASLYRVLLGVLGPDRLGSGFQFLRLVCPFSFPEQGGVVHKARGHVGVRRSQGLLHDRQRALVERLGLGVAALGFVERGQVVEARGHVGVRRSEGLLHDRQRALMKRLGLGVAALGFVE